MYTKKPGEKGREPAGIRTKSQVNERNMDDKMER
jgi:hypothetical protein